MIDNPDWHKPKIKPYLHQISLDCIEKLVDCQEKFNKGVIDADTCFEYEQLELKHSWDRKALKN